MSDKVKEVCYEIEYEGFGEGDYNSLLMVVKEKGEEIARIQVVAAHEIGYYKVEYFLLRDWERRLVVGIGIMHLLTEAVSEMGGEEILIYPCAETYEGADEVPVGQWYEFLETLGFRFTKEDADRHSPCQEMKVKIE